MHGLLLLLFFYVQTLYYTRITILQLYYYTSYYYGTVTNTCRIWDLRFATALEKPKPPVRTLLRVKAAVKQGTTTRKPALHGLARLQNAEVVPFSGSMWKCALGQ